MTFTGFSFVAISDTINHPVSSNLQTTCKTNSFQSHPIPKRKPFPFSMSSLAAIRALRPTITSSSPRPFSLAPRTRASFHTTPAARAYKDDQDRESLKPRSHEGTKSSGDEAASKDSTAFDRNQTDPRAEKNQHPDDLEISGANQELSKPQGDDAAQEKKPAGTDKKQRSGGSRGTKSGKTS